MAFGNELVDRFGELRDADARRAPSLRGVVHRAPVDRRATGARRTGVAAIAVCVLLGGGIVARRIGVHRTPTPSAARWRSPTTSLVPTTGQSVLAPPPLLSSVLDGATTSILWRKGD